MAQFRAAGKAMIVFWQKYGAKAIFWSVSGGEGALG